MAVHEHAVAVDQEGEHKAEGADRRFELLLEGFGRLAQAPPVSSDRVDRHVLDRELQVGMAQAHLGTLTCAPALDGQALGTADDLAIGI